MNKLSAPNNSAQIEVSRMDASTASPARPEFIRLPLRGACPWTGLTRAKLNQLILPCRENNFRAPVRSVSLAPPGKTKGVRLIHLESLLAYLHEHSVGGERNA
jgi:hypothetical protein